MEAKGWKNGSQNDVTGGGYGVRIDPCDRDAHFRHRWNSVTIEFPDGNQVDVNLSQSFWRICPELRKAEIGRWMVSQSLAPWPYRRPPRMVLYPLGSGRFVLHT